MGSQKSTNTTVQELSPEQRALLDLVMPTATDIASNTPSLYPGSTIAPFTDLQTAGQGAAVDAATGSINDLTQGAIQGHSDLQSTAIPTGTAGLGALASGALNAQPAQNFFLSGQALSPDSNPFLQQTADAAVGTLADNLTEKVLPSIRRGAQTAGQVGSSRQGIAEGLAIKDFQTQAGAMTSDIFSQGYGQGLQATSKALTDTLGAAGDASSSLLSEGTRSLFSTPDIAGLALLPSQILSAVGGQQQMLDQAMLSEDANRYLQEQLMPFMIAQDIANLAFGMNNGSTTSTASQSVNPLNLIFGLGSMLFGL